MVRMCVYTYIIRRLLLVNIIHHSTLGVLIASLVVLIDGCWAIIVSTRVRSTALLAVVGAVVMRFVFLGRGHVHTPPELWSITNMRDVRRKLSHKRSKAGTEIYTLRQELNLRSSYDVGDVRLQAVVASLRETASLASDLVAVRTGVSWGCVRHVAYQTLLVIHVSCSASRPVPCSCKH